MIVIPEEANFELEPMGEEECAERGAVTDVRSWGTCESRHEPTPAEIRSAMYDPS
jgi:hypothetical protein